MTYLTTAKTSIALITTATTILCTPLSSTAQLPPAVEVDRLIAQAEREIRDENFRVALATFDSILELIHANGWEVPADFWINDAQLAQTVELHARALESVTRYLEMAGQQGEHYWEALALYEDALEKRQAEVDAEARRAEAAARRQAQAAKEQEEREAWTRIRTNVTPQTFQAYMRQYPTSAYRSAAQRRLAALQAPRSDDNGWTSLHYAAAADAPDLIRRFAQQGGNVDAELRRDGAALTTDLRRRLRELGYNFESWTRDGETPLHIAAFVGARDAAAAAAYSRRGCESWYQVRLDTVALRLVGRCGRCRGGTNCERRKQERDNG